MGGGIMKSDEVAIHGRVIARRAETLAKEVGIPVKALRVTEHQTAKSHTVTLTITLNAGGVDGE